MDPHDIYSVTAKGFEELREKSGGLPPEARFAFFMIDGRTPARSILSVLSGVGVSAEILDLLHERGYIAKAEPSPGSTPVTPSGQLAAPRVSSSGAAASEDDRFFLAKQFLNETVVHAVGLRSFLFTLRLEKAGSFHDLRVLLEDYDRLIRKGKGTLEAEVLIRRAKELTS